MCQVKPLLMCYFGRKSIGVNFNTTQHLIPRRFTKRKKPSGGQLLLLRCPEDLLESLLGQLTRLKTRSADLQGDLDEHCGNQCKNYQLPAPVFYKSRTLRIDCRVQSDLAPLVQTVQVYCDHGLQWSIQTNSNSYFGKNFLIGYSIFKREKPFADEEQSGYIWGHVARNQQKQCNLGYGCEFLP